MLLIPIGITSWKVYDKSNHSSVDIEKMLAEQDAIQQTMESNSGNVITTETKEKIEESTTSNKKETEELPCKQ